MRGNRQIPRNLFMEKGLRRFKMLGCDVSSIIDVGAAAGSWTVLASELWPQCSFLLFEPLEERRSSLENLRHTHNNIFVVQKAAGNGKGFLNFTVTEDLDGSSIAADSCALNLRTVEITTIQDEIKVLNLDGPYIVKLDTHGFEVPIIEGCSRILNQISLFIIECYGFKIAENSLLFWEMCDHMDKLGFRLFDIVDVMHRPVDGAFWQCDAFFIRKDNAIFSNNKYSG